MIHSLHSQEWQLISPPATQLPSTVHRPFAKLRFTWNSLRIGRRPHPAALGPVESAARGCSRSRPAYPRRWSSRGIPELEGPSARAQTARTVTANHLHPSSQRPRGRARQERQGEHSGRDCVLLVDERVGVREHAQYHPFSRAVLSPGRPPSARSRRPRSRRSVMLDDSISHFRLGRAKLMYRIIER